MNELWKENIPEVEFSQKEPHHDDSQTSKDKGQEFVDNTTLHGIRYVFMKRHIFIRLLWLMLLLTSGGYYVSIVYGAINKYYSRPINTVLSRKNLKEMDFPAVTICSLNIFAKSKILMTDDNPLFASSGLNISSCAVTSRVRANRPCGLSLLCSHTPPGYLDLTSGLPNCTSEYRQELVDTLNESFHRPDLEEFLQHYSQNISALVGPICNFGWELLPCSVKNFVPLITPWGMCYTFNSGTDGKLKTVYSSGIATGFSVILDAQTYEYTQGKFSEGFKVIIHGQGEYVDEWEGINVGPGQHAAIALSQKKFKNLEEPFATNCTKKALKTFSTYTQEGCLYECDAENTVKLCNCRPAGYKGAPGIPTCITPQESRCAFRESASLDVEFCDCQVPCFQTKYSTAVSYSKFPDTGTANELILNGYYDNEQYQRDNLVFLEVGFKSLSYEMQEQQPAYGSSAMLGEIGGNMGLFLGCSVITICEFFDFLITFLARRRKNITHPA
ncbi:hypothetical protein ACROYT_G022331 [Oculina patagonica]